MSRCKACDVVISFEAYENQYYDDLCGVCMVEVGKVYHRIYNNKGDIVDLECHSLEYDTDGKQGDLSSDYSIFEEVSKTGSIKVDRG